MIVRQFMFSFKRIGSLMIFWYITWTNLMIRNTHNNIQTVHTVRFPEKILETENSSTIVLIMAHYICSPVCHNTVWNDGIPPMIHLKMIYHHHCRLTKELLYNFFHTIGNGILLPKLFWPTVRKKIVLVIEKNFWNSRLKPENLQKFWDYSRTICSNSERSEQFLVTECCFNLFLEVS